MFGQWHMFRNRHRLQRRARLRFARSSLFMLNVDFGGVYEHLNITAIGNPEQMRKSSDKKNGPCYAELRKCNVLTASLYYRVRIN